jgi:hypothetical protein
MTNINSSCALIVYNENAFGSTIEMYSMDSTKLLKTEFKDKIVFENKLLNVLEFAKSLGFEPVCMMPRRDANVHTLLLKRIVPI